MPDLDRTLRRVLLAAAVVTAAATGLEARRATTIGNGRISIVLDERGITALTDISIGRIYKLKEDGFRVVVDGTTLDSATLPISPSSGRGVRERTSSLAGVSIDRTRG